MDMASTLYITLSPAETLTARGWSYQVDGTDQVGFFPGALRDAGTPALCMSLAACRSAQDDVGQLRSLPMAMDVCTRGLPTPFGADAISSSSLPHASALDCRRF